MNKSIIKFFIFLSEIFICYNCFINPTLSTEIEIPSSFNPVGSGARAMGMGGAFIAVADDATAASWNPGGLIQLTLPEFSVVLSGLQRNEDIDFGTNPEGAGSHNISETNINYLSAVYPFNFINRNMVLSLTYQHLYDFNRDWSFVLNKKLGPLSSEDKYDYSQKGRLSALGFSYCIQIIPELSAGFTMNFWKDNLTPNKWEQKYHITGSGTLDNIPFYDEYDKIETYLFNGFNMNLGMLWRINYKLTLGAVLKTPFKAELDHKKSGIYKKDGNLSEIDDIKNEELKMPMSYGIGIAYKPFDNFLISADVYKTEWNDFILSYEGNETCPLSGKPISQSHVKPTYQIRAGLEYRLINEKKKRIIPLRFGLFYDPAPAEESPDDFYGFSIGTGITLNNRFSLDFAYQYRFGNDVGKSMLEYLKFSQDVNEHMLYLSVILYKF